MASLDIRRLGLGAMALIGASLVFKGVKGKEISKKEEDNLALEIGIDSVMGAESLRGRWKDGATRIVHGVSVEKTPMAERLPNEKPDYYLSYKGFNARLSYSGVVFNLPCWELYSYGLGKRRQGCFENPMEAILSFKSGVDSVEMRSSAEGLDAEDEPLFPGLNCSHCGSDEDTYYGEPETHTPDGIVLNPNHVEAKLHIWCDSCGEASPIEDYDAESFEAEAEWMKDCSNFVESMNYHDWNVIDVRIRPNGEHDFEMVCKKCGERAILRPQAGEIAFNQQQSLNKYPRFPYFIKLNRAEGFEAEA